MDDCTGGTANPVLIPLAELGRSSQFGVLDTFSTVALAKITSTSREDEMPIMNYERRSNVFAGHETAEQEQLTPKDLLFQGKLTWHFSQRPLTDLCSATSKCA